MLRSLNGWKLTVLLTIVAVSTALQFWAIKRSIPKHNSDLLVRVVGTRDALKGMNPYSAAVLSDIQTACYGHPLRPGSHRDPEPFAYPALIVPLLAPFVGFAWPWIRIAFLCLVIPGFLLSSYWWVRIIRPSASKLTFVLVIVLSGFAWPAVWGLRLQQPTMVIAILMAAGCFALVRRADFVAGACMTVALVKPQVSLPLVLWLLAWSMRRRRWRFPVGFGLSLVALSAVTEYMVPGWFPAWVGDFGSYASSTLTLPVCEMLFGKWAGLTATVLLGLWSIWILWGMLDADGDSERFGAGLALALAATVLIIPVRINLLYEQVFLLPAVVVLLFAKPRGHLTSLMRNLALVSIGMQYFLVFLGASGSLIWPGLHLWVVLPFLNQPLPVVAVVAMLLLAEEQSWSSTGLKRFWRGRRAGVEAAV